MSKLIGRSAFLGVLFFLLFLSVVSASSPAVNLVVLNTSLAFAGQSLGCVFNVSDPDVSDKVVVNLTWFNGSSRVTAYDFGYANISRGVVYNNSNGSVPAGVVRKGEGWKCNVTANDGSAAVSNNSAALTVSNSAPIPIFSNITSNESNFYSTSTLLGWCNASDADNDALTYNFKWYLNGNLNVTSKNLQQIAYYANSTSLDGASSVFVSGGYAYVASYFGDSLTVFDISVPSNPQQIAYYANSTTLYGAYSVFVSGGYAYVASDGGDSLTVFDISVPSNPQQIAYYANSTSLSGANSVFVSGGYAYVASAGGDSLTVFDISVPSNPQQIAYYANSTSLYGASSVFVSENYAYIASNKGNSLTVFDISVPSNPQQIAYYANNTSLYGAYSVFVSGSYAYVASYFGNSLTVFDISVPSNPQQIAYYANGTSLDGASSVFVSGGYAYVASAGGDSLTVFDIPNFPYQSFVSSTLVNVANVSNLTVGQNWTFQCAPKDGSIDGSALNSTTITIIVQNTDPVIVGNVTSPAVVYTSTDWLVNLTVNDSDAGDTLTAYVQFYINKSLFGGVQSKVVSNGVNTLVGNLSGAYFVKGDVLDAEVWADDGTVNVSKVNLSGVTVSNSPPTVILDTPADDYNSSLSLVFFNWTGGDADNDSVLYHLYINDSLNVTTNYTNVSINFSNGVYRWNVSVDDGSVNVSSGFRNFSVKANVPSIVLVNPPGGLYRTSDVDANVVLYFSVDSPNPISRCDLSWFGSSVANLSSVVRNVTYNFTIYSGAGNYNWSVRCYDIFGNYNDSEVREIWVDLYHGGSSGSGGGSASTTTTTVPSEDVFVNASLNASLFDSFKNWVKSLLSGSNVSDISVDGENIVVTYEDEMIAGRSYPISFVYAGDVAGVSLVINDGKEDVFYEGFVRSGDVFNILIRAPDRVGGYVGVLKILKPDRSTVVSESFVFSVVEPQMAWYERFFNSIIGFFRRLWNILFVRVEENIP